MASQICMLSLLSIWHDTIPTGNNSSGLIPSTTDGRIHAEKDKIIKPEQRPRDKNAFYVLPFGEK